MIENLGFKYAFWIVMGMATITFIAGINLPIMGIDATQYASISMEMAESGNYLEVIFGCHLYHSTFLVLKIGHTDYLPYFLFI